MTLVEVIRQLEELKEFQGGMKSQREHLNKIIAFLNALKQGADQAAEAKKVHPAWATVDGVSSSLPFLLDAADG